MLGPRVRGRLNAWGLAALDGYMHWKFGALKRELFRDPPAVAVELGSGSGTNLRYLPRGLRLIAVEPNEQTHPMLRRRAAKRGIELELHAEWAEQLDLPSDSVDYVFCSLVLCSVRDPAQVIAEVKRVLKPGGRFVCIEHVEAPEGTRTRRLQHWIRRPWFRVFDGCDVCRDTGMLLRSAGFSRADVQPMVMRTFALPIKHQIRAVCVK